MSSVHKIKITNKYNNRYYKSNPDLFDKLIQFIETNRYFNNKLIKNFDKNSTYFGKFQELTNFIDNNLKQLNNQIFSYNYITKCYWIINDLIDFPICPVCKKQDNYKNKNIVDIRYGYAKSCCRICSKRNLERNNKISKTHNNNFANDPEYWNNRYNKTKQTCLIKYKVENPSQSELIKDKKANTVFKHYGVNHIFKAKEIRNNIKNTWLKNYGVEHISQSNYYKESFKNTCLIKYGVEHPMHNADIRQSCHAKYLFNNIYFDSSWEIALYIYLTDNNIKFEYQPRFPALYYEFNNIEHRYFPDFKINTNLYEIKGDQLIDKNGNWIPPPQFKRIATNDEYLLECQRILEKQKCAIQNNVKILTFKDCKIYLDYINETYGKNYLKSFKYKKQVQ